jgi:hypothetical protein
LARRATLLGWFDEDVAESISSGMTTATVAIRGPQGNYTFTPDDPAPALALAVARLGEEAVMSMVSEVTRAIIDSVAPDRRSLILETTGARIPIVQSLADVHYSLAHSATACLVLQQRCVLIWSNDPATIMLVAQAVEKQLLVMVFGPNVPRGMAQTAEDQSMHDAPTPVRGALDEKNEVYIKAVALEEGHSSDEEDEDLEGTVAPRPTLRLHSLRTGIVMILVIVSQSLGVMKVSGVSDEMSFRHH